MPEKPKPHSLFWRHRRLLFLMGLLASTGIAGAAYLLVRVPLPPEAQQAETSFLTDVTGARLASLSQGVNRVHVKLDRVPQVVRDAVVSTEDKGFYEHGGVDPVGIARATFADVRGRGALQGGSTITQQYVKNVYLGRERTLTRKLREAALAVKVERKLSKDEILERYLNTVYFGRGAYGVQAAAQAYFGMNVEQLGLREGAYLAGLIRSPVGADALEQPERANDRRNRTLIRMVRAGKLNTADRDQTLAVPVESYVVERGVAAPTFVMAEKGTQYFVEQVRKELLSRYPEATVYGGGLRVKTTLDLRMQAAAYDAVYGFLDRPDDPAGALVAVDANGEVRAMVGGRDYNASKVNLAVGAAGGGSGRQPGSTFKPFVLAELVRQGYSVQATLPAPPTIVFPNGNRGRDYEIGNYEGGGSEEPISVIDATKHSVNTVYAQMIKTVGPAKVVELATKAGVTSPLSADISLTLGTSEVSVLDMASSYSTFANRGEHVKPVLLLEVTTVDGHVLERAKQERVRAMTTKVADVVNYCLQQVVRGGSGSGAAIGRTPLAGKTGTTQDYGDAWFVGYTPRLTAAVWMGYPEGASRRMTNVRGRDVNGGSFPATIFKRFMAEAVKLGEYGGTFNTANLGGKPIPPVKGAVLPTTTTSSTSTTSTTLVPVPTSTSTTARPPKRTTTTTAPSTTTTSSSTTSTTQKRG